MEKKSALSMSHNQYSVYDPHRHYMWGLPEQQEPLSSRLCAGAAFVCCVVILMFLG